MKNNKIVGYDIDVINYICKELGYKLEVIEMSFDGIIPALKSGKVDCVVMDELPAKEFVGSNSGIKILDGSLTNDSYGMVVKKSNKEKI